MKILVIVLLTLFILSLIVIAYSKYDYQNYIKKYANKYTVDKINNIIEKNKKLLEKESEYDRTNIDLILDDIELWEQVRNYKLSNQMS